MRSGAAPTEGDVMEQWKLYGAIYADAEPPADASRVGVSATAEETLRGTPRTPERSQRSQTISIMDFNRLQPGAALSSPAPPSGRRLFKENKIVFSEIIRDADKDWNKEFQTYLEMPGASQQSIPAHLMTLQTARSATARSSSSRTTCALS